LRGFALLTDLTIATPSSYSSASLCFSVFLTQFSLEEELFPSDSRNYFQLLFNMSFEQKKTSIQVWMKTKILFPMIQICFCSIQAVSCGARTIPAVPPSKNRRVHRPAREWRSLSGKCHGPSEPCARSWAWRATTTASSRPTAPPQLL
jgi:hypothetical protein